MKKFLRKLLPTIVMLAVSATLVGTSTFAWFSMNNKVTVTGMVVKTKVSSNLLIAPDTLTSETRQADDKFTNSLNQVVKGILEPASTLNANDFFYTIDAKADGSKLSPLGSSAYILYNPADEAVDSAAYADLFSETYGVARSNVSSSASTYGDKAVPFVDYVFQLKATNTEATNKSIVVEQLTLMYRGSFPTKSTAHRVAFFFADISGESPTVYSSATGSSATYTVQSSANFNNEVVSSTGAYSTPTYVTGQEALVVVPANQTKYYKVVVRLWLEGQDTTCNNETFMNLNDNWELGLKLALTTGEGTATKYINQVGSSGVDSAGSLVTMP